MALGNSYESFQVRAEAVQLKRIEREEYHGIRWLSWLTFIHPSNHIPIVAQFFGT